MSDVIQNQELDRFELVLDGDLAGYTAYQLTDETITFTHTEIVGAQREHGLRVGRAERLVELVPNPSNAICFCQGSFARGPAYYGEFLGGVIECGNSFISVACDQNLQARFKKPVDPRPVVSQNRRAAGGRLE